MACAKTVEYNDCCTNTFFHLALLHVHFISFDAGRAYRKWSLVSQGSSQSVTPDFAEMSSELAQRRHSIEEVVMQFLFPEICGFETPEHLHCASILILRKVNLDGC
jgi:hypothetical protein